MTDSIQMFQYNGSEYNQLNPSLSNLSNNSNQLGGIDSSQYATKEYVSRILSSFSKISTGTYQGDGNNTKTINIGFAPKFFTVLSTKGYGILLTGNDTGVVFVSDFVKSLEDSDEGVIVVINNSSITLTARKYNYAFNNYTNTEYIKERWKYNWTAIG